MTVTNRPSTHRLKAAIFSIFSQKGCAMLLRSGLAIAPILVPLAILGSVSPKAAIASPEIASGDGVINADIAACLYRTDTFINTLDIEVERGAIDRTGYLGDGSFRILCYPNPYGQHNQSLVVVFAAHDTNFDIADTFVQIAVDEIADQ